MDENSWLCSFLKEKDWYLYNIKLYKEYRNKIKRFFLQIKFRISIQQTITKIDIITGHTVLA